MLMRFMFIWRIENYSYCGYGLKEELISPEFILDMRGKTVWTLGCYPGGYEDEGYIGFCLNRCRDGIQPVVSCMKYELSFHAADGTLIKSWVSDRKDLIDGGSSTGDPKFVKRNEVLYGRSCKWKMYLTNDTLLARCRMWILSEDINETSMYRTARTHIRVDRVAFIESFERFGEMQSSHIKSVAIKTSSAAAESMLMNIFLENDKFFGVRFMIYVERGCGKEIHVSNCKIYMLDNVGDATLCGKTEFTFHGNRSDHWKFPLYLSKEDFMDKKRNYLPLDRLLLKFQFAFSTGEFFHEIEEIVSGADLMDECLVKRITAGTVSKWSSV